ncbi:putative uncharacterized protein [Prevotella sp. CAG:1185]|uniref:winged helix-turn-helix domain-containing protein n=1 Tax=uncultured Prevotella sp. TaxID=159272 RepID=UPI00033D5EEA|nr:winged helix-turn-helix domain-containing protein [uncultured Prevotella sp.]CCY83570.1 putative uncharacterized protein [Prevotella sp. CAG:1185]
MTEKNVSVKKAATKAAEKKAAPKRSTAKKVVFEINAETVGFKAGDVYQALATAEQPLSVAEIAKAAKITTEETLLGMGWLFKEGKIKDAENKITLA